MTDIIESAEAISETIQNHLRDNDRTTTIDVPDISRKPTDIFHLNSNLFKNDDAVNTPTSPVIYDTLPNMDANVLDSLLDINTSTSTKQIEDYKIGDIIWAKIGKYPYWPSIVCVEPTSNTYQKKKKSFFVHVRFCSDNGRRSWTKVIENYCGKIELLSKYPDCLSYLKNSKKLTDSWNLAVVEADNLLKLDGEFRMIEFFKTFCNSDSLTQSVLNNTSEGTSLNVRNYSRKRTLAIAEQNNDFKIMKTKNSSVNCTLSRSDKADNTVSDISTSNSFLDNLGLDSKQKIVKKISKSINGVNHDHKKLEISTNSNKKNNGDQGLNIQSSSNSKKHVGQKNFTERNSTTVLHKSSLELGMSESEPFFKKKTSSTKNKELFTKTSKRACVVCKNIDSTVKCKGPCQSFFHKECLNKSEERYHINTSSSCSTNDTRITQKNKAYIPKVINNIKEEITTNLIKNDDHIKTISLESDDLFKNNSSILTDNENTLNKFECVKMHGTSEEKNVDTSIVPINIKYMCSLCIADKTICFVCALVIEDSEQKIVCKISSCGKYYHKMCLKDWSQCEWIKSSQNNVQCICPQHVCHYCVSGNPEMSRKIYFPSEKLIRCIKCPTTYHRSEYCLPAGSQVLTYNDIICSRHFEPYKIKNYHVNANWCFICGLDGGLLIFCDLCPTSSHAKCLNKNPSEFEGSNFCRDCQTGRYPLYDEIVWVKIGKLWWWPAQVVFPKQIPDTVNALEHFPGQFVVQFFGLHDYYWVNRGQVYSFVEADIDRLSNSNHHKNINEVFQNAVVEAAQAHNRYILDKAKNDSSVKDPLPSKYLKIKFNKPIGNVKKFEFDITAISPCECNPSMPNPCGPDSDCINRMLMIECQPKVCLAGNKCNNQSFENALYPAMDTFLTENRGWGLRTLEDIKEGSFVIEYVGDLIDEKELQSRCFEMNIRNEQNFYFLTLDGSRTIDAGPKGNLSRFMNHSCEPNCITQKWIVNGDTRIGLFALHDIPRGTELVFDYRLQSSLEVAKKPCNCGAARCSKFIGVKVKEQQKKVFSTKRKAFSKSNQTSLELKDKVSDLDKSKSSKVINNNQNISTTEKKLEVFNADKIDLSMMSKSKTKSIGIPSTILKNRNLKLSETQFAVKNNLKYSTRSSTNMTKGKPQSWF